MSSEVYPAVNTSTNMKQYKIVVLGNPNVGKTTLTYKLCEDKLLDNVEPTISLDLRLYVVNVEGENIKVSYIYRKYNTSPPTDLVTNLGHCRSGKVSPHCSYLLQEH